MKNSVRIIGGGLAGSEAAWQLARRGVAVELYEMRPQRMTEAHATANFGELVCSNSLRSDLLSAPAGLLKAEMRQFDSLVIRVAEATRVPAGSALAVDRDRFASALTAVVESLPQIKIIRREVKVVPDDGVVILATGPLTSADLSSELMAKLGEDHLYFYDAISPIVTAESVDMNIAYRASRYDKGGDDYLNLPLTREEYYLFIDALVAAQRVPNQVPTGRAASAGKRKRAAASPRFSRWCCMSRSRRLPKGAKCSSSRPPPASCTSLRISASACSSVGLNHRPGRS